MEYIALRGTANLGVRMEVMIGQLLVMMAKHLKMKKKGGVDFELYDFAIHLDKPELPDMTFEYAQKKLMAITAGVKRNG